MLLCMEPQRVDAKSVVFAMDTREDGAEINIALTSTDVTGWPRPPLLLFLIRYVRLTSLELEVPAGQGRELPNL